MGLLRNTIGLLTVIGGLQACALDAQAQYQAYTYTGGYGWYPYYAPQAQYAPPTYNSPYAMPFYYQPQFQYAPPTFMGSPYIPTPQAAPTLASSEAMQNASAQAQSAQLYLGTDSDAEQKDKYGNSLAEENASPKSVTDEKASAKNLRAIAAMAAPHRLNAMQYDRTHHLISWPMTLRAPQFADVRYKLDMLFHERTPKNSGEGSANAKAISEACQQMQDILKQEIKELHPMEYIAAQQFIDSLSYEARFAERT